jgi:hypothetical protein
MPNGTRIVDYRPGVIGLPDVDMPKPLGACSQGLSMESFQDSRTLAATGFPGVSNW